MNTKMGKIGTHNFVRETRPSKKSAGSVTKSFCNSLLLKRPPVSNVAERKASDSKQRPFTFNNITNYSSRSCSSRMRDGALNAPVDLNKRYTRISCFWHEYWNISWVNTNKILFSSCIGSHTHQTSAGNTLNPEYGNNTPLNYQCKIQWYFVLERKIHTIVAVALWQTAVEQQYPVYRTTLLVF